MNDTSPDIEKRMIKMMMSRTPTERLRMVGSMFDTARKLMRAGIQHEMGMLNESQMRAQLFLKMYKDDFTQDQINRIMNSIPRMQLDADNR